MNKRINKKMKNHYYLDKIIKKEKDIPKNKKENKIEKKNISKYGFPNSETFSLDFSLGKLIYERVCRYYELADNYVDLSYHKVKITILIPKKIKVLKLKRKLENIFNMEDTINDYYDKKEVEIIFKEALEIVIDYLKFAICDDDYFVNNKLIEKDFPKVKIDDYEYFLYDTLRNCKLSLALQIISNILPLLWW